ncbi:hypothetical protein B0H13DRAFT_1851896 [Mycena leptocephala]|nr:hypothetical protein B0H13DRAFT_1851896 [Mycena leptocephala]
MSSNSSVIISGLVVLEDPRVVSPRVTVFAAAVYVGSENNLLGSLRYFKDDNDGIVEYPAVGLYHLTFTREPEFEVYTQDVLELEKLVFVGDIKRQPPSPPPQNNTPLLSLTPNVLLKQWGSVPQVHLPSLWVHPGLASFQGNQEAHPVHALEGTKVVDRFTIEVDTVAFLAMLLQPCPRQLPSSPRVVSEATGQWGSGSGSGSGNCRPVGAMLQATATASAKGMTKMPRAAAPPPCQPLTP